MYFRKSREELMDMLESLKMEYQVLKGRCAESESERERLVQALAEADHSLARVREGREKAERENHRLNDRCHRLNREIDDLECKLTESRENSGMEYALFESFVENASQRILLIDTAYSVRYVNTAALALLGLSDDGPILDQRLFDFLGVKDTLKLKERIDRTFLKGAKEKVKDITFHPPNGNPSVKLRFKMYRVRYRDKPSIKLELK
ncbi:MAG: PAS domain-containing protein [Thermodesulfobacteriota bacterium]